jgi:hypothetical protein
VIAVISKPQSRSWIGWDTQILKAGVEQVVISTSEQVEIERSLLASKPVKRKV